MFKPRTCLACGEALPAHAAPTTTLCANGICAWKYAATPETRRCRVCRRIIDASKLGQPVCADSECNHSWYVGQRHGERQEYQRQQRRAERAALEAKASVWRDACAQDLGFPDATSFTLTVVPHNSMVDGAVPSERRDALRMHLEPMVSDAVRRWETERPGMSSATPDVDTRSDSFAKSGSTSARSPHVDAALMQACIACRGSCCRSGGEHAYLTTDTILRYLRHHPHASASDIIDAYLAPVAERTMIGRCIYQHVDGCTLPREQRSDTCNDFYCEPLWEYQRAAKEHPELPTFIASMDETGPHAGIFFAADRVQIVKRSAVRLERNVGAWAETASEEGVDARATAFADGPHNDAGV